MKETATINTFRFIVDGNKSVLRVLSLEMFVNSLGQGTMESQKPVCSQWIECWIGMVLISWGSWFLDFGVH